MGLLDDTSSIYHFDTKEQEAAFNKLCSIFEKELLLKSGDLQAHSPNPTWNNAVLVEYNKTKYVDDDSERYFFVITTKGDVWFYRDMPTIKDIQKNKICKIKTLNKPDGGDYTLFVDEVGRNLIEDWGEDWDD